jgi:hypothetical protein
MRTELGIVDGGLGVLGSCDDNGFCDTPTPKPGTGYGFWNTITDIFTPIIKSQFPAIPEGSVLIQGPGGQQFIRYASGQQVPYSPSNYNVGVTSTGGSSLMMIGAVALIALVALKK